MERDPEQSKQAQLPQQITSQTTKSSDPITSHLHHLSQLLNSFQIFTNLTNDEEFTQTCQAFDSLPHIRLICLLSESRPADAAHVLQSSIMTHDRGYAVDDTCHCSRAVFVKHLDDMAVCVTEDRLERLISDALVDIVLKCSGKCSATEKCELVLDLEKRREKRIDLQNDKEGNSAQIFKFVEYLNHGVFEIQRKELLCLTITILYDFTKSAICRFTGTESSLNNLRYRDLYKKFDDIIGTPDYYFIRNNMVLTKNNVLVRNPGDIDGFTTSVARLSGNVNEIHASVSSFKYQNICKGIFEYNGSAAFLALLPFDMDKMKGDLCSLLSTKNCPFPMELMDKLFEGPTMPVFRGRVKEVNLADYAQMKGIKLLDLPIDIHEVDSDPFKKLTNFEEVYKLGDPPQVLVISDHSKISQSLTLASPHAINNISPSFFRLHDTAYICRYQHQRRLESPVMTAVLEKPVDMAGRYDGLDDDAEKRGKSEICDESGMMGQSGEIGKVDESEGRLGVIKDSKEGERVVPGYGGYGSRKESELDPLTDSKSNLQPVMPIAIEEKRDEIVEEAKAPQILTKKYYQMYYEISEINDD